MSHPRLLSDDEHSEADDRQEGDETVGLTLRVLSALGFEDRGNLDYMLKYGGVTVVEGGAAFQGNA